MPKTRKTRRRRRQRGGGPLSVVAGIPKVAWSITKAIEKRAKKNALKNHKKRMEEVRQGKRKPTLVNRSDALSCEEV